MKITKHEATHKHKHGVDMWVYPTGRDEVGFVYDELDGGHFEEFYDKVSTFMYYILNGAGTFYLDGQARDVGPGDIVVIPPKTKIYYRGKMKMILVTTPAWRAENEVHVRDIPESEK